MFRNSSKLFGGWTCTRTTCGDVWRVPGANLGSCRQIPRRDLAWSGYGRWTSTRSTTATCSARTSSKDAATTFGPQVECVRQPDTPTTHTHTHTRTQTHTQTHTHTHTHTTLDERVVLHCVARQVDIYTNYDCDVQCTNLFEDMCRFLSKNAFPLSGCPSAPEPQTPNSILEPSNPKPQTRNPKPQTSNPNLTHRTQNPNLKPQTPNPKPQAQSIPRRPIPTLLSHTNYFEIRFVKVNSPTNQSTYSSY